VSAITSAVGLGLHPLSSGQPPGEGHVEDVGVNDLQHPANRRLVRWLMRSDQDVVSDLQRGLDLGRGISDPFADRAKDRAPASTAAPPNRRQTERHRLNRLGYGNRRTGTVVDRFWLLDSSVGVIPSSPAPC
jgi:hypothetical protein